VGATFGPFKWHDGSADLWEFCPVLSDGGMLTETICPGAGGSTRVNIDAVQWNELGTIVLADNVVRIIKKGRYRITVNGEFVGDFSDTYLALFRVENHTLGSDLIYHQHELDENAGFSLSEVVTLNAGTELYFWGNVLFSSSGADVTLKFDNQKTSLNVELLKVLP